MQPNEATKVGVRKIGWAVAVAILCGCNAGAEGVRNSSGNSTAGAGGSSGSADSGAAGAGGSGVGVIGTGGSGVMVNLPDAGVGGLPENCEARPVGLLRDLRANADVQSGHPDFQNLTLFVTDDWLAANGYPEAGIVAPTLGADRKPVFSGGTFRTVESQASFDEWYRDVADKNMSYEYELPFVPDQQTGTLVYDTDAFFPLDGRGFGNYGPGMDGVEHNFHFTFELHMTFAYGGGEVFRFRGDDDLFVFINDQLVIDLGGVHGPMEAEVNLDEVAAEIGIEVGSQYPIDIFHAERFTDLSNFRMETTLAFNNCDPILIR